MTVTLGGAVCSGLSYALYNAAESQMLVGLGGNPKFANLGSNSHECG